MARVAGSLKALLSNLIDYAGLYPPAGLPLNTVVAKFQRYLDSDQSWMLNRLVLPAAKLTEARVRPGWRVTLLVDSDPEPLPPEVETLESKGNRLLSLPTYCEVPIEEIRDAYAKLRTGGVTPELIPFSGQVATFLHDAAARRLPFKATAGLHHPLRSAQPLTYAPDSPRAVMHGFLNVFVAAAFAWHGAERSLLRDIIKDEEAAAFKFSDDCAEWRGHAIATAAIQDSRRSFAHCFGSCSFEEPVAELQALGLLP
jgi:hypothetical protein